MLSFAIQAVPKMSEAEDFVDLARFASAKAPKDVEYNAGLFLLLRGLTAGDDVQTAAAMTLKNCQSSIMQLWMERLHKLSGSEYAAVISSATLPTAATISEVLSQTPAKSLPFIDGWAKAVAVDLVACKLAACIADLKDNFHEVGVVPMNIRHAARDYIENYGKLSLKLRTQSKQQGTKCIASKALVAVTDVVNKFESSEQFANDAVEAYSIIRAAVKSIHTAVESDDMELAYNETVELMNTDTSEVLGAMDKVIGLEDSRLPECFWRA